MSAIRITIDGNSLDLAQVRTVARSLPEVTLAAAARQRVHDSAQRLKKLAHSEQTIYGVNTGFGIFADQRIELDQAELLSANLVLSHAVGVGPPFSGEVVRAAMLIRANTLAAGHSGVRPILIDRLLDLLNSQVTPYVPSAGSLGSSGDLAPLAHLALTFTELPPGSSPEHASGRAWYGGELVSGQEALAHAGIARLRLGPKEGLALTNGATFSAALLALSILDISELLAIADIAAAMSMEALLGVSQALDDRLHSSRGHPGQRAVAARMRALTQGSDLMDSGDQVQDAYSLRCIPQIHGPGEELLEFVDAIALREINAATDNPLLYDLDVVSGGNFHGQPLGLAADYLKLPLAEAGALSERRTFRLTSAHTSHGLPPMLVGHPDRMGLESGLMMLQYTAASLALENQTLAAADSIRSLPTSAGQEDLNANSTTACRNLRTILANVRRVIAIEMICAAQALDLRATSGAGRFGIGTQAAHSALREVVPFIERDQPLDGHVRAVDRAIRESTILRTVEAAIGRLPGLALRLSRGSDGAVL